MEVGNGEFQDNFTDSECNPINNNNKNNIHCDNNNSSNSNDNESIDALNPLTDTRSDFEKMLDKNKAHFSLWCITSAPLIAGNNLENMTDNIRNILTNKHAIEINQNYLNNAGDIIQAFGMDKSQTEESKMNINIDANANNNTDIWYKPLPQSIGDAALLFLNRIENGTSYNMSVSFKYLPLNETNCDWFDVWDDSINQTNATHYTALVAPQSVKFVKLYNCKTNIL